jgi:hypothetical protein
MSQTSHEHAERIRAIAADYQAVFTTPVGQRVLKHLVDHVLLGRHALCLLDSASVPMGPMTGERAIYLTARHDAILEIERLLEFDFRAELRPKVYHKRSEMIG